MPQRSLQRRLHLHLAELIDGEVEVLLSLRLLVWIVFKKQFSKLEPGVPVTR